MSNVDDPMLREYALTNLRDVLSTLRSYDRASVARDRAHAVPRDWRSDRLEAARSWAQIAEALRPEPEKVHIHLGSRSASRVPG